MGPFKCPDCGIWWAGLEHRCQLNLTGTGRISWIPPSGWPTVTTAVHCNCPESGTSGSCPIHDVQTAFTGGTS